jgi:uncharacterized protein (TIGR03435 family)
MGNQPDGFGVLWTLGKCKRPMAGMPVTATAPKQSSNAPSIFTALQEQLGLKLQSEDCRSKLW